MEKQGRIWTRRDVLAAGAGIAGLGLLAGCGQQVQEGRREIPVEYAAAVAKIRNTRTFGGVDDAQLRAIDQMRAQTVALLHRAGTLHFGKEVGTEREFRLYYPFKSGIEKYQCVAIFESSVSKGDDLRALFIDGLILNGIVMNAYEPNQGQNANYAMRSTTLTPLELQKFGSLVGIGNKLIDAVSFTNMLRLFKGGKFDEEMAEKIRTYCSLDTVQFREIPEAA